jgi:hypothetical protein
MATILNQKRTSYRVVRQVMLVPFSGRSFNFCDKLDYYIQSSSFSKLIRILVTLAVPLLW